MNDPWSGLGTGLVTGLITGLVAFGLFYWQRREDRKTARDVRTIEAVDSIRAATSTLTHRIVTRLQEHRSLSPDDLLAGPWLSG